MTLGVVSDTHNRIINVEKIIDIFNDNNVTSVIHTGDITQGKTLQLFSRLNCPLIGVYGNNDLKELDLKKVPAISETIDWAKTLLLLHAETLDPKLVRDTLNVILKFQEDIENVDSEIPSITAKINKG